MVADSKRQIDDRQTAWQLAADGTPHLCGTDTETATQDDDHSTIERREEEAESASSPLSSPLAAWTQQIVAGEASVTDVPAGERARIAREVKAYTDHFPDIGRSPTVRRLIEDLQHVEVGVDG